MIVLLASYPRSGNTLVRHTIEAVYGVPTFTVYNEEEKIGLWPDRKFTDTTKKQHEICFVKTHSEDRSSYPTIYIVRDGRDAIVSEAYYAKRATIIYGAKDRLQTMWDLVEERGPWSWSHHCRTYQERMAPTAIVRFEELLEDPIGIVKAAVEMLEVPIAAKSNGAVRLPSFESLRQGSPDFYRCGTAGAYRKEMPPELQVRFWEVHDEMMERMGYERERAACLTS